MNLDIKNFLNNALNRSKATLIAIGLTLLIVFYLNATKTDTDIVDVSGALETNKVKDILKKKNFLKIINKIKNED